MKSKNGGLFMDRETIRKGTNICKNTEIFLYGRLKKVHNAKVYCKLHKCYLEAKDITEKGCNKKKCKYKKEV